ncbi:pyrimidine dimer DNA glycosylase/endonuclease V [Dermabacter vaginalis]|uniref:pyrimidine dimer DNA glycosylase/endonuclease V n=1 Tax=Dermabacter vaginalis TaxID=1630135 RepID=UPI001EF50316|nr:pyrimidine dimer DNA glycosylase/endonuclease V [Dermabacter vaginalis]MCG7442781.1 pyrimidine dimer DNA glycosylase/endonuclease V [Dermabacter vaginalis]
MRLWSLHPRYLDRMALVACWREALLAQKVLAGLTTGYTKHPQLERFRESENPEAGIGAFLTGIALEADSRGYTFNDSKIHVPGHLDGALSVTTGQLAYEAEHLRRKVRERAPQWQGLPPEGSPLESHPLFRVQEGDLESWERA